VKGTGKLYWFAFLIFVGFVIAFSAQKICSFDIWWHLKAGKWTWQNKAIPHTDPFSYTFKGAEWIDFEWLFQSLVYLLWETGGFSALILFKIIVICTTFFVLFLTCRKVTSENPWLTLILLFLSLNVARMRFLVRPQILFLLFVALSLYLLTRYREGSLSYKYFLTGLLCLQIVWVNSHSSFLIGIFLVGTHVLGRFVPLAIKHHKDLKPVFKDQKLRQLFLTVFLLAIISMANPYGPKIYLLPLKTIQAKEVLRSIAEWVPLDIRVLGLLVIDPTVWFRAMFVVGLISFLLKKENFGRVEDLILFGSFSYLAFQHHRFCGLFAISAAPIILNNFSQIRWKPALWIRSTVFILVMTLSARDLWALVKTERLGLGVWRNYPEATVDFVKKHHIEGKIFNTYGLGGFLIWHLWPRVPVFIDGRSPTVYDQDFFWLYSLAERKNEIWQKLVKEYDVDIVLVSDDREIGYARLCNWLDEDEKWRLVAFDDKSVLYLRKDSFPELTERWGFKYLRPSDLSMDYAKKRKDDEDFLRALGEELKEACRRFPRDFYPFYYLAIYHQIYGTEEHLKEAVAALRKAIANRPHFARGYYELGFTLLKLKRYGEAVTALKKAISLRPDLPPDAYYYLGASYYQMGDIDRAIKALKKYKRKAGLRTRVEAYRFLGRAYLQKYKLRNALSCFKREAYLAPTWETYANMGIVYFGLQKLNSARDCFERAVSMNPREIKVLYNLALTYEKLGLHDKAKEYFRRVAETKERSPGEAEWIKKAAKKIRGY